MQLFRVFLSMWVVIFFTLTSCKSKLDQKSMFNGRSHKNNKGVYNTGLNSKKPMSVQIAEGYDKQTKHDDNPKKAVKKELKELEKKKRKAKKKREKYNKKRRVKIKTAKEKSSGGK